MRFWAGESEPGSAFGTLTLSERKADRMSVVDDLFDVRGQVALVTGGASGLGYAFASILAEAGATVVIADWNGDAMEKAVLSLSHAAAAARGAAARGAAGRGAAAREPQAVTQPPPPIRG